MQSGSHGFACSYHYPRLPSAIQSKYYQLNSIMSMNEMSITNRLINKTSLLPRLRTHDQVKERQILNSSVEEKNFRLTSNQVLKSFRKFQTPPSSQLRQTLLKPFIEQKPKRSICGYQILKEIGKGGFASVYEVQDSNGSRFAMKEYQLQNSFDCYQNEVSVGQYFFKKGAFKEEFVKCPGSDQLIAFVDRFKIGKRGYIIQQLSKGSLAKQISQIHGVFHNNERVYEIRFKEFYYGLASKNHLANLIIQLCQSVQLLNQEGFIHCDLKLENILVHNDSDGGLLIKLIDFGSTFQLRKGLPKITITPEYMPPELLILLENGSNSNEKLNKIDNWSIGCILLQILTGLPLWFKYKCKVEIKNRTTIQLGFFALTNRQYAKIIKKQKQLCDNIHKIQFTMKQFQKYRPILKKLLAFDPQKRMSLRQCIQQIKSLQIK